MARPKNPPEGITEMSLKEAVDRFLKGMKRTSSKHTVASKRSILNVLVGQCGEKFRVYQLTREMFDDAFDSLVEGASPEEAAERKATGQRRRSGRRSRGSVKQAETTLNQFAIFCHDRYWLTYDIKLVEHPVHGRQNNLDEGPPVRRPKAEADVWANVLEEAGRVHPRLRIVVAFGLYCARRISEMTWMKWGWIDWERSRINFYNQKGDRLGAIPLVPEMREELTRYRNEIIHRHGPIDLDWYIMPTKLSPTELKGAGSQVFYRGTRSPYWPMDPTRKTSVSALQRENLRLLRRYGLGTNMGVGTHTWRRSGATEVAMIHGIEVAQYLLDHKSSKTTKLYTDNDDGKAILWAALLPGEEAPIESVKLRPVDDGRGSDRMSDNVIPLFRRGDGVAS